MPDNINLIVGVGIIILNLIPFVVKKPKYLFLTILVSLIMLFLISLS
jgi:hypothetical protein